jgi:hypothetical protein
MTKHVKQKCEENLVEAIDDMNMTGHSSSQTYITAV